MNGPNRYPGNAPPLPPLPLTIACERCDRGDLRFDDWSSTLAFLKCSHCGTVYAVARYEERAP